MTDILGRPMSTARIVGNIVSGIVLAAVLFGLVAVIVDERCSRNVRDPGKIPVQEILFKE